MITKLRYANHLVFILWSGTPVPEKQVSHFLFIPKIFQILESNNTTSRLQISELTTQTASQCSTHARGGLIRLCPEPPERRCLSRGTPRQDQPCLFVQLASSSDAERVFSTMNDIYHGRSWGTCLPYVHPLPSFALRVGNDLQ